MPQQIYPRKPWHTKVRCPICKAAKGSLCRSLVTSEMIKGTHYERTVDSRQYEPSTLKINKIREKIKVGIAPKKELIRLERYITYKAP